VPDFVSIKQKVPANRDFPNLAECLGSGGCLLLFSLGDLLGELLLEALYAAGGIDQLLFAGEEWMAIRADFDAKRLTMGGRTGLELVRAARTVDRYSVITWMDALFHSFLSSARTGFAVGDFVNGRA
jgi:hypothetical protein